MIPKLFEPLAMKVAGGLAAVLLIASISFYALWQGEKGETADLRDDLAMSEAKHAITRASLDKLEHRLSEMIEAGKLTRERVDRAIEAGGNEREALREQAEEAKGAIVIDGRTPPEILGADL